MTICCLQDHSARQLVQQAVISRIDEAQALELPVEMAVVDGVGEDRGFEEIIQRI